MTNYIDYNESRRLNRLKNTRSYIGSNTSHNGWQRQQIEKRRKEQLRQRKKGAKKKPLGDGIQVDTKISKSDAFSKCGLKLKFQQQAVQIISRLERGTLNHQNHKRMNLRRQNPAFA